jgi:TRAP-type C4-dicarboxylate transport system substrate-binding protein
MLGQSSRLKCLNRCWRAAIVAATALLVASCEQQEGREWDMSLPWSVQEFHTKNAIRFAETVFEETAGALKINVHPGAVLGLKGPESMRALAEGLVQMAEMPAFQQVGTEPILGLESLPFLVENQTELRALYDILRPRINRLFEEHGLKVIYIVPWPNQNIYTKVPVQTLADLRGVKIRTYDKNTSELMDRLGLVPVQMASQDVVPALASGVVDAVMTSTTTGAAQKYWEFLDYIYRTNHLWISNIMAVNLESWNQLRPEVRQQIEAIAARLEPEFWAISRNDDAQKLAVLEAGGITTMVPDPALLLEMRQAARPMWQAFADDVGPEAEEVLRAFLAWKEAPGGGS